MKKKKRLLRHIFPSYLLITLISLVAVTWFASSSIRNFFLEQTAADLLTRAHLFNILEAFIPTYADLPLEPQIDEPVPGEVLERLLRIPYFSEAYDERGIAPQDFVRHPAVQATAASFAEAMAQVESFAASQLQ